MGGGGAGNTVRGGERRESTAERESWRGKDQITKIKESRVM